MSSIKLTADSNGGTFELKAPSSSSNTRVLTLPDTANGTVLTTTNPKPGNIIQIVSTTVTAASTCVTDNPDTNDMTENLSSIINITNPNPIQNVTNYLVEKTLKTARFFK